MNLSPPLPSLSLPPCMVRPNALDYPGAKTSYAVTGELAERAFILNPYNLFVQLSLAFKCFLYDEKERFFHIADRMLEKKPESTLRLGALGFHLSLYGDWERGKQILDSVMHGHMEYPKYFHGATTLFFYRDKSFELALKEAKKYKVPGFFWGPMVQGPWCWDSYPEKKRHKRKFSI